MGLFTYQLSVRIVRNRNILLLMESRIPHCSAPLEVNESLTPQYVWHERFRFERERLNTFENWPLKWLDQNKLATSGMFYTGIGDLTKCYFCEVVIGKWDREDDPVQEHLKWSPNCPLLLRRTTNNIPINEKTFESLLPAADQMNYDTPPTSAYSAIPVHDYSIRSVRFNSFAEWPRSMKQKPEKLAEAGFYYKGIGDSVVCFSCLSVLKDWEEDDDPWEQHALWMGEFCPYVKLVKGDEYIKCVHRKFKNNRSTELKQTNEQNQMENSVASSHPDDKVCKICFDKECNTAYVPCGHVVACAECALVVGECPVCRAAIKSVVRLYFS